MTFFDFLDCNYGPDGDKTLRERLAGDDDPQALIGPDKEPPLLVATRRRRVPACAILLDHGADINATTTGGKTAYAHAIRRGFADIVSLLVDRGADQSLSDADRFAVAVTEGRLDEAREILSAHPHVARTGNAEEDRLLADMAGRNQIEPVRFLIEVNANLTAPALDDGTPLHQAAWFGQPANARLLLDAGAPLELFDSVHASSPLGWAVHGSRFSGLAEERQDDYVALARLMLEAGAKLHYPGDPNDDSYRVRLLGDASPQVREVLLEFTTS